MLQQVSYYRSCRLIILPPRTRRLCFCLGWLAVCLSAELLKTVGTNFHENIERIEVLGHISGDLYPETHPTICF